MRQIIIMFLLFLPYINAYAVENINLNEVFNELKSNVPIKLNNNVTVQEFRVNGNNIYIKYMLSNKMFSEKDRTVGKEEMASFFKGSAIEMWCNTKPLYKKILSSGYSVNFSHVTYDGEVSIDYVLNNKDCNNRELSQSIKFIDHLIQESKNYLPALVEEDVFLNKIFRVDKTINFNYTIDYSADEMNYLLKNPDIIKGIVKEQMIKSFCKESPLYSIALKEGYILNSEYYSLNNDFIFKYEIGDIDCKKENKLILKYEEWSGLNN